MGRKSPIKGVGINDYHEPISFIDKEGNPQINDAIGPVNGLILEEEAIRIIKSLPTAIPANCDGKPINIMFAIPILFQMQE